MSCNLCFQNQNQESSDGTQVPDGDGLSDTRIHKDGNDEERDHAVSIMFFFYFFHIGHFLFFQNRMKCACFHVFLQHSIVFFSHTLFQQFTHDGFFLQFMIYSFCNLSIRVQEKRDDTKEEALQNNGADSNTP